MGGSVWSPGSSLPTPAPLTGSYQWFTAIEGQVLFTLTLFSYVLAGRKLMVKVNGNEQQVGVDVTETSTTSFTLTTPCEAGDLVEAFGVI